MSRALQPELHSRLQIAAALLQLPLTGEQLEQLAAELAPGVAALLAAQDAQIAELTPVPYTVTGTDAQPMDVSEFAGCVTRTGLDVDLDSPSATLADHLRRQPDVTALEISDAHTLGVTVRPQSLCAWRWWLQQLEIAPSAVTTSAKSAEATGQRAGVTVHLIGDGVPELLSDVSAARLMGLIDRIR